MSDTGSFTEESLTEREHNDPDKHWVGETLPAPSVDDVKFAGVDTSAGASPFPARADHSHDTRARFCIARGPAGKAVAPGATTYIDGIQLPWGGEDFRNVGSTQLFLFPQEGYWRVRVHYRIVRSAGVFPAATPYIIRGDFDNATSQIEIELDDLPTNQNRKIGVAEWVYLRADPITSTYNVQFVYRNFDTVFHTFFIDILEIFREASSLGVNIP